MKNLLEYKGYHTKIEFDSEGMILYGKIEGIGDLVTFETNDPARAKIEFENAVDEYLDFCKEVGKEPEKEYKGTFNVRIAPKLHRDAAMLASRNGESLNQVVEKAIQNYVKGTAQTEIKLQEIYSKLDNLSFGNIGNGTVAKGYGRDLVYDKYDIEGIKMTYQH